MDKAEQDSWSHAHLLLDVQPGDYIVHVNVPEYGKVTVGKVASPYYFEANLPDGQDDGRHCFKVTDVFSFDRNDELVFPSVNRGLKPRRALQRLSYQEEFLMSLERLKARKEGNLEEHHDFLSEGANELFKNFVGKVHACHPGKDLEAFIAEIFRKIPNVYNVKENGSGWRTDNGADLIITYRSGIAGFEFDETMVVQIKSYEGEHRSTEAVGQIEKAMSVYEASLGLIITTAESTEVLENAVYELSERLKKPVYLMAGQDVARFILTYGMDLLKNIKN